MSAFIVCDMCGWTGSSEELDVKSEEVDGADIDHPSDWEDLQGVLGEPCCPQCRTTAIGDCCW